MRNMNKRVSWEEKNPRDKRKEWSSRLCTKEPSPLKLKKKRERKENQWEGGKGNEKELELSVVKSE